MNIDWKRAVRLPIWAIALALTTGVLSVFFAPGAFKVVWLVLVAVAIGTVFVQFNSEIKRLKDKHVGQDLDKAALKSDVMQSQPVALWLVILLALAPLWLVIALIKLVGFLIGLALVVLFVALLVGGALLAYKVAKKRNFL
ncbi:MAG TPA: hypothetical protein VFH06_05540 [Candidatus Saccharimonadales bacterium]|nr:hypothetical protein [Candidatus Saccharimonadales bacterium]